MNNVGKNWDDKEEDMLIKELNKQTNLKEICDKHERKSGGIIARIKKILDDPDKSNKLNDKTQIIIKYFNENDNNQLSKEEYIKILKKIKSNIFTYESIKQIMESNNIDNKSAIKILEKILLKETDIKIKNQINKLLKDKTDILINNLNNNLSNEELIINYIKEFDSVFTIKKVFTELKVDDILNILKEYIKSDNPLKEKKDRIKFIIRRYKETKEEDDYDKEFDAFKVKKKIFGNNNINEKNDSIKNNTDKYVNNLYKNDNLLLEKIINILNSINSNIVEIKNNIKEMKKKINYLEQNIIDNNIQESDIELEKELNKLSNIK